MSSTNFGLHNNYVVNSVQTTNIEISGSLLIPIKPNDLIPTAYSDKGKLAYDSQNDKIMYSDGTQWIILQTGGGSGTVTQVNTGVGLTGGPIITSTGTIALANTTVTPGSYTYSSITVDAQGRLTSATSGTSPITTITAGAGLSTTGGTTPTLSITNTTVTASSYTYASFTVNAQGQLTAASSGTAPVTSITAGTGLSTTGGTTPTLSITNTLVTPGPYTYGSFTVNAQGQLTAASSGTTPVVSVVAGTGITVTGTTTATVSITNTAVSAGVYYAPQFTVNAQGQLTNASNILTTKGDLLSFGTLPNRFAVGSDGTMLYSNSGAASGLSWLPTMNASFANIGITASTGVGALTIGLVQSDGSSALSTTRPGYVTFRNTALTSGGVNTVAVSTGPILTIPSGTNIGTTNSYPGFIYVYGLNNAGTIVLAVSLSPQSLDGLASSSAISGGSSNSGLYSTAAQTNLPIQYLGKIIAPQTVAGTWGTNPSEIWMATGYDYAAGQIISIQGDIPIFNNGLSTRLPIGSANTFLTSNGSSPSYTALNISSTLTGNGVSTSLTLANTAVTPASYTYASFTVDAQGRLTAASNGTAVTSITAGTGITIGGTVMVPTVAITNSGVAANTYITPSSVTVNAQGQVTAISSGATPVTLITAGSGIVVIGSAPSYSISQLGNVLTTDMSVQCTQSLTNNTSTRLLLSVLAANGWVNNYPPVSVFSTATGVWTSPISALYSICYNATWPVTPTTGNRQTSIQYTSNTPTTTTILSTYVVGATSNPCHSCLSTVMYMQAGTKLGFFAIQTSGRAFTITATVSVVLLH